MTLDFRSFVLVALAATGFTLGASTAAAQPASPVRAVASALLRFEAGMKPAALQGSFRADRAAWRTGVDGARSPQQLVTGLVALEAAMTWEAVDDTWRGNRTGWLAQARGASTPRQVASLLLALEHATTWEAMDAAWHEARTSWLATLEPIARPTTGTAPASAGTSSAVGAHVEVLWNGTWYAATILAANPGGTFRVHYDGWASSWDEDVTADRVR